MRHAFVIGDTCYWHHEWERCAECGHSDRPDEPGYSFHLHHDEELERQRRERHPEHPAQLAMQRGDPVEWVPGAGWRVK